MAPFPMMRFEIRSRTEFTYDELIRENHNEVRAAPVSDERQHLIAYRLTVKPGARAVSFTDYWGTRVDAFGIREPHIALEILAEATVETSEPAMVTVAPTEADLRDPAFADAHWELLQETDKTEAGDGVREIAAAVSQMSAGDPVAAVLATHRQVHHRLTYQPDATSIATSAEEALSVGSGVCQDYAHLAVSVCRHLGIPARYVSGYFFTSDDATGLDATDDVVQVATHAWFEAAIPGHGWYALDPTNSLPVGARHITVGRGRDYDDVAPIRGVVRGSASATVTSGVEMRRLSEPARPQQLAQQQQVQQQ